FERPQLMESPINAAAVLTNADRLATLAQ
ncbi:MAG: hypothetical protein RL524_1071, partial [Actinomycetota bacterium]